MDTFIEQISELDYVERRKKRQSNVNIGKKIKREEDKSRGANIQITEITEQT